MNLAIVLYMMLIFGFISVLFVFILPYYKKATHIGSFEECFTVFVAIIQSEIDMYENNVFENRKAITNSNYDNYYKDLSTRIIKRISPNLKRQLCYYITEEAMILYVARTVQNYLSRYIKEPL